MYYDSEYTTKPRIVLVQAPHNNKALRDFRKSDMKAQNFYAVPDYNRFIQQYDDFIVAVQRFGIDVSEVEDSVDDNAKTLIEQNPNSIFTRDTLVTLPWEPHVAIVANMTLLSRQKEPEFTKIAATKHNISEFFEATDTIRFEGGDVIAVTESGRRTLYVGTGRRTTADAAIWLANSLIPKGYLDRVVCVAHRKELLHLDTCFTILPNNTVLCAQDALLDGFIIDQSLTLTQINPIQYLTDNNYKIITTSTEAALRDQGCNMLFVGENKYLAFYLPDQILQQLEQAAGITIYQIDGSELAKANGGIHCLTSPIY